MATEFRKAPAPTDRSIRNYDGEEVSLSTTTAATQVPATATYAFVDIYCATECFIKIAAADTAAVADGTSFVIPAAVRERFVVDRGDYINAILAGGTDTLYIHPVH